MTSDQTQLQDLVEVWRRSAQDVVELLRSLDEHQWATPTDLPGWDVRAIAAHLAHMESALAGDPQEAVEVPAAPHVKGVLGEFTEGGVIARASRTTDEIVDELERSVAKRHAELTDHPPADPAAPAPGFAALVGWSWQTLLTNRPLDLWMHEQDVRRAVGRPGHLDTAGAVHTAAVYARSLPYVLGKKVGAPPGTTVVLEISGAQPQVVAAEVGADGRGRPLDLLDGEPTSRLLLDFEDWILLAGGRRDPSEVEVEVHGDADLGRRLLHSLGVTL